ncbi:MAG: cyclase family protein [Saccharofermentanales bacterium]
MKIIDISMPISPEMAVYKGRASKRPAILVESDFSTGSAHETRIEMNVHTGTHVDTSLHIIPDGATIDSLDLARVVTPCKVLDFSGASDDRISREHLCQRSIASGDFILLKTRNSLENILETEYVYVDRSGAEYLRDIGISGVGIDALGIERAQPDHETHKILFGADIIILEGLRLCDVEEGDYFLVAAPVYIAGSEGAPVRAFLMDGRPL